MRWPSCRTPRSDRFSRKSGVWAAETPQSRVKFLAGNTEARSTERKALVLRGATGDSALMTAWTQDEATDPRGAQLPPTWASAIETQQVEWRSGCSATESCPQSSSMVFLQSQSDGPRNENGGRPGFFSGRAVPASQTRFGYGAHSGHR